MALSSMTGFAHSTFEVDGAKYSWDVKSVNARGLEVRLRMPSGLDHLEGDIRTHAREALRRGSCFFALTREAEGERRPLELNEEALTLVLAAARRLAAIDGVGMATADGLLALPGVLRESGPPMDAEAAERRDAAILAALKQAVAALNAARLEEGERLRVVLEEQLSAIAATLAQAESLSDEAPEVLKARIRDQVALLTADGNGLSPERLHQEAVLAATRADVREELDRLKSHVAGARNLLESGDSVGRRLEFLAQEFNREANTLCSKAFDRRLTALGVELKAIIDRFREQVQNLA